MRSREDLFKLIQSMSKSEKRYFVLDAKKSGRSASRYLALFDAINKMEEFDEEQLKKKFPTNLSADKAYLYEAILRSMRDYRSQSSKAAQVKERLMDARYLYERGLYDQSTSRIMEAKAMAAELEDQFTLLEINKEEQVSLFDRRARVQLEHIERLNEEREFILDNIEEELIYLDLNYRLGLEVNKEFNLKEEGSIEALNRRIPVELLDERNKPNSPQAIRRFYLCNAVYYNLLGELEKVYDYFLKAAEWWDDYPAFKEEEFHRYIINISNLVNVAYKTKKHIPAAQKWLQKLKGEQSSKSYHNEKVIFLYFSISNLLHLLNQNDFKGANNLLPEIIEGQNKFGLKRSIVLSGNIATVYFLVQDYKNCIRWTDYIAKSLKSSGREDIHRLMRIYKVISHYELGQIEEAESSMRAANRLFKTQRLSKGRFEDLVLNFYLKQLFTAPINEIRKMMAEFRQYLSGLKSDSKTDLPLGTEELILWLDNRKR
jgi:hypothetical protein